MKFFTLEQLAKGIRERHVGAERARLVEKWSRTGLLRGLNTGYSRETMAQLLENQAAQVLKESNALSTGGANLTSSGQIQGFSNIAFPIVRRVFGGLVANELVSIQPMSLPSGLIFYLDYTYGSNVGGNAGVGLSNSAGFATYQRGQSIYNNPPGKGVQSGSLAAGGQYDLVGTGFTKIHLNSNALSGSNADLGSWNGAAGSSANGWVHGFLSTTNPVVQTTASGTNALQLQYDPQVSSDIEAGNLDVVFLHIPVTSFTAAAPNGIPNADLLAVDQISLGAFGANGGSIPWGEAYQGGLGIRNLRRLNRRGNWSGPSNGVFTPNPLNGTHIQFVLRISPGGAVPTVSGTVISASAATTDILQVDTSSGATLTIPSFESDFGSSPSPAIPEIDIKIESISITATTRKLRARWSPELAQDLNAYHSMDAEVELTSILSEQVALEIDREILGDLVTQANGANFFWSRAPGVFVNKETGIRQSLSDALAIGPSFTGTVREWYETLIEVIIDVANTIHRKTLRGSANFIVTGPDVSTILEASIFYKPKFTIDGDGQVSTPFTIGAESVGTLSNRFTVYKDPYFPRNKILVGYKGGSYLETGYVYAPYVPLIVTPTIFAPEDFTPRKGVMTRYGKKLVRSDFYGTVTVLNMNII
jgi:hypothetical protein